MNIRHLEIFITVCKENSFTKAANTLYITQPAVSHAIHELESYTNTSLFERFSKQIVLTPAGKHLLEKATELIHLYKSLQVEATQLEQNATLRIGSSITIANDLLPQSLVTFKERSSTPVQVEIASASTILKRLENYEIDIALVEGTIPTYLTSTPFHSHTIVPVCAFDYPIDTKITIQELVKHPLLLREKGSALRDTFDSLLLTHNLSVTPTWNSTNSTALLKAAMHHFGIAMLPNSMAINGIAKGQLKILDIKDIEMINTFQIVELPNKSESSSSNLLKQILLECPVNLTPL